MWSARRRSALGFDMVMRGTIETRRIDIVAQQSWRAKTKRGTVPGVCRRKWRLSEGGLVFRLAEGGAVPSPVVG